MSVAAYEAIFVKFLSYMAKMTVLREILQNEITECFNFFHYLNLIIILAGIGIQISTFFLDLENTAFACRKNFRNE